MPPEQHWITIDTTAALERYCQDLKRQLVDRPWLAIDTEFMRERTYYPQLCLIQVGTTESVACIDPLQVENLDPLLDILYDPQITKVFHAAHQDLEIFYHLRQAVPAPVFDTQLAAPILGYPHQAGYAVLVQELLGITLEKGHARTDWSQRPLSAAQLGYAADDVRYLAQVYLKLHEQLSQENRLNWLKNDFERLSDPSRYANDPATAWKRIRATKRLKGKALSIVKELAAWRETRARSKDIPRNWLLRDDLICDLAKLAPRSNEELNRLRGISEKQRQMLQDEILPLIESAREKPHEQNEKTNTPGRPSATQEAVIEALLAVVQLQAVEHNMHPTALATRKDIERWLLDPQGNHDLLQGWRQEMVGKPLQAVLNGQHCLQIVNGHLRVIESPG